MTNFDLDRTDAPPNRDWAGLAKFDQAIRDNRLMEYRLRKSWTDPWGRKLTVFVATVIVLFAVFAVVWELVGG